MPKISVCIPTYNCKHFLQKAIDSVYCQTFKDYEILIIDDGSMDGTEKMLKDNGFNGRYHWFEHMGQQAVRNKLIELAKGDYVSFLDSDDELFPDSLDSLMSIVERHGPETYAFGHYVGIDEAGRQYSRRKLTIPSPFTIADLFEYTYVSTCGTLFATELYRLEGGFNANMKRCGVYNLQLMLAKKYPFVGTAKPLFKRRRHSGNANEMNYEWRMIEAQMLEEFYCQDGGKDVVPKKCAMKRLAKEFYRAGKCAYKEKKYLHAIESLRKSICYRFSIKAMWLLMFSMFLKKHH